MGAKYIRIADELSAGFEQMRSSGVSKLPSEAELAETYACSRQTIRSALALLESKGRIIKRRGSGSYLSDMKEARSKRVAVIVEDQNEYTCPAMLRDMRAVLTGKGYALDCYDTNGLPARERAILDELLSARPACVLLEPISNVLPTSSAMALDALRQAGVPLLYLGAAYQTPASAPCISEDNFGGAYELLRYLAGKGHKKIAGIFRSDDSRGLERYQGCMQASLDLMLPFDERAYFWFSAEDRRAVLDGNRGLLRRFLQIREMGCTAAVCQNDEIAFRLLRTVAAEMISVPEEFAVVSFDDSYYTTAGGIGITSMSHAPYSLGAEAATAMLSLMRDGSCRIKPIPWQLTIRDSG